MRYQRAAEIMDWRRHSSDRTLPIGFCFSFPCQHTGIAEGTMLKLTKKFQNEGLVGQDPVKGFQRALDRQGANVRFAALCHCQLLPPSKEAHLAAGHLDQRHACIFQATLHAAPVGTPALCKGCRQQWDQASCSVSPQLSWQGRSAKLACVCSMLC